MSPEELRQAVWKAIRAEYHRPHSTGAQVADAALAVVREAMREPSEKMLDEGASPGWSRMETRGRYRAMLAASPLREPGA